MRTTEPKHFEAWLRDLETTQDPQATGALTTAAGDCCLGRACKVAIAGGVDLHVERSETWGEVYYNGSVSQPPAVVAEWLGLTGNDAAHLYNDCIHMNDNEKRPFSEIATEIRKKVTL